MNSMKSARTLSTLLAVALLGLMGPACDLQEPNEVIEPFEVSMRASDFCNGYACRTITLQANLGGHASVYYIGTGNDAEVIAENIDTVTDAYRWRVSCAFDDDSAPAIALQNVVNGRWLVPTGVDGRVETSNMFPDHNIVTQWEPARHFSQNEGMWRFRSGAGADQLLRLELRNDGHVTVETGPPVANDDDIVTAFDAERG